MKHVFRKNAKKILKNNTSIFLGKLRKFSIKNFDKILRKNTKKIW